ncbi:Uncharacterised protein [Vibrio cholerae]|uniref:Uncharacterized protein n=1 Tax=Vibrio cholerae TaxID=666 RepID=A0A655ZZH5_VIBCL|nr:Uncharacterised protein [Vibrio cholerae]CSC61703.1 Uncharacterised protein [Vibrio cholerae]CSC62530.1 Uncharacterised protein [Vibrio cholerae]CSC86864.1 Uncharacterised protein [Vibrio cholerae]CSI85871.1 Uncharacterised protein [Vibrio cholerae]
MTKLTFETINRGDIDDSTKPFFTHSGKQRLGDIEYAIEVSIYDLFPCLMGHFFEHTVTRDTCVVDHHINGAFFFKQFG